MTDSAPQPALRVDNLRKTYRGGIEALRDVSIEVGQGEFFALLGPNGAGKTTLIGIVSSLVNKSSGSISVFGKSLDEDPAGVRSMIGLVPQEVNFNLWEKVIDIIVNQAGYYGIPRKLALERCERYLHELDLWQYRNTTARALSGGFKRRLMVARALIHEPPLLILDEPTAGVDIELRRSMWTFLRQLNEQGVSIILTTHYLEEAESLCRRIAIIQHGEISEQGDMRELLDSLAVETFVLDLTQPVNELPDMEDYSLRRLDATTLELDICRGQSINGAFARLSRAGIEVRSLRNKANRLEEIFLRLVREDRDASRARAS
jgi:ABC-2 type transport system ATP-binding protein